MDAEPMDMEADWIRLTRKTHGRDLKEAANRVNCGLQCLVSFSDRESPLAVTVGRKRGPHLLPSVSSFIHPTLTT